MKTIINFFIFFTIIINTSSAQDKYEIVLCEEDTHNEITELNDGGTLTLFFIKWDGSPVGLERVVVQGMNLTNRTRVNESKLEMFEEGGVLNITLHGKGLWVFKTKYTKDKFITVK